MNELNQNPRAHFAHAIQRLKDEKRYRVFVDLERDPMRFPIAMWRPDGEDDPREVTIWCSNDYLGMGGHPKVREAAIAAVGLGRHLHGRLHFRCRVLTTEQ